MSAPELHFDFDTPNASDSPHLSPPQPSTQPLLHSRVPYRRTSSIGDTRTEYQLANTEEPEHDGGGSSSQQDPSRHGLGISSILSLGRHKELPRRVPVGLKSRGMTDSRTPETGSTHAASPTPQENTPFDLKSSNITAKTVSYEDTPDGRSTASSHHSPYINVEDTEEALGPSHERSASRTDTIRSEYITNVNCPTHRVIVNSRWSWLTVTILVLAVYSTILSGLYLGVAIRKPRYGKSIRTHGGLSPSTASLLSTLFAKTIELSFVTVFVAFLGQVLSRRAIVGQSRRRGVSIAEMTMRTWIMQPGTLITHWETVKYAALSFLGVIALTAAFVAILYTTAADALVSPKLKFGPVEHKVLWGQVMASFANPTYLGDLCQTPISRAMDDEYRNDTCLQIQHAGQAYHNYLQYLSNWTVAGTQGNSSLSHLSQRPLPVGIWFDNTTVRGSWVQQDYSDVTAASLNAKRMINNITMAMPHENVLAAAVFPRNNILQPQELAGLGEYDIIASVPSPTVNVLCAGMTEEELDPLIYTKWPGSNGTFNASTWANDLPSNLPGKGWNNHTVVSDIFHFSGDGPETPPIFPKLPLPYNTLVNSTNAHYGDHAIYILGGSPPGVQPPYVLCAVKGMQYPKCSTRYHASMSGGTLSSHCDDNSDRLAYDRSVPNAPVGDYSPDYRNVASEWANSLSLGTGISDGNAANSRLLTQLIPPFDNTTLFSSFSSTLPSIAEALAVLAGSTLLASTQGTPFVHYWNNTDPDIVILDTPETRGFNASLKTQDYASGGAAQWQGMFYVVLAAVFFTNVVCLIFFFWTLRSEGQITDYTEPQNLFALAVNSPPSTSLVGACGAGPEGDMLKKNWVVSMEHGHGNAGTRPHFYVQCRDDEKEPLIPRETLKSRRRSKLSSHHTIPSEDFEVEDSAAVQQYMKLATGRNSPLLL